MADVERGGEDAQKEAYLHDALRFAIEARGSSVEQQYCNVYDLDPTVHGTFGVVFCASVLLHITDPVRALYAIRGVTGDRALIATSIDNRRLDRRGTRARFVGRVDGQTFWVPNMACLEHWALSAGFKSVERVSEFRFRSRDGQFDEPHGVIRAR